MTVAGGGDVAPEVIEEARALGAAIAGHGWILVCGGRAAGVMDAVAKGAREAGGLTVGILPGARDEGVSEHVDVPVLTGLGDARNVVNVLTGEVLVALQGGAGTLSEVALALKSGRPVVVLGWRDAGGFERWRTLGELLLTGTVDEAVAAVQRFLDRR